MRSRSGSTHRSGSQQTLPFKRTRAARMYSRPWLREQAPNFESARARPVQFTAADFLLNDIARLTWFWGSEQVSPKVTNLPGRTTFCRNDCGNGADDFERRTHAPSG